LTSEPISLAHGILHTPRLSLLNIHCDQFNTLGTAKMDTNYGEKTNATTPSYPHEKINSAPSRDGQKDIEAGENGVNVGENDMGLESNNSATDVYVVGEEEGGAKRRSFNLYWKIGHFFIWLVMTGWVRHHFYSSPTSPESD
jgi:hypothetical protein